MPCTSKFNIISSTTGYFPLTSRLLFFLFESDNLLHPLIRRAYTVPVQVGSSQQNLSLQVDTGSSDLVRHTPFVLALPELSLPVDCI